MTRHIVSADGTRIAYESSGSGPLLILVDGALCSRGFGPGAKFARLLEKDFTVYRYDRRGRGESGDTQPYGLAKEVEDLAALIQHGGGSAILVGLSSGAALSLHAAAARLPVDRVLAYEPPYVREQSADADPGHEAHLRQLVASGNRGGAVTYFMRDMVGAPAFVPIMMRLFFWMWPKLVAVAHTLPYDAAVMTSFRVPHGRFATIPTPVLVMNGTKTDARLKAAAAAVAATIPGAHHIEVKGQTHNVQPAALIAAAGAFLTSAKAGR
jgi:pimeloyl-ACP methyl ester carboxylesterase